MHLNSREEEMSEFVFRQDDSIVQEYTCIFTQQAGSNSILADLVRERKIDTSGVEGEVPGGVACRPNGGAGGQALDCWGVLNLALTAVG